MSAKRKRTSGKQKATARKAVKSLARAAGASKATARKALANFVPSAEAELADVFFVLELPDGKPGRLSCESVLAPTFDELWRELAEYAQVELQWWCQDHGFDPAAAIEQVRPALFHIAPRGLLSPVGSEAAYLRIRNSTKREGRRLLFCDLRLGAEVIQDELTERLREVLGKSPRLRFAEP